MFQLSFLLAMLIFFSLASAKRDDYVLPGIPSLAILLAALFTSIRDASMTQRLRNLAAIIVAALAIMGLVAASTWISIGQSALLAKINPIDRAQAELLVRSYLGALSLMLMTAAFAVIGSTLLIFSGVRRKLPARTALGLGSLSLLGVLMFTAMLRPETSRERTLKYAAADISRIAADAPVYVVNENQELAFYLGREAPQIVAHNAIREVAQPAYLFAYQGDFRGPTASLKNRLRLLQQWERLGKAGPPALYQLEPEGLKPDPSQDK
jgi:hypothetical protein